MYKYRVGGINDLAYILGQTNLGPWFAVAIYPKKIVVDPTSGRREGVIIYGGRNLSEYRQSITFGPIADKLLCYAGDFAAKIWFDGKFLVAKVAKKGVAACAKIYLEFGIVWKDTLELICQAMCKAKDNYWRMMNLCHKILDGPKIYRQAVSANLRQTQLFLLTIFTDLIIKNYEQQPVK